MTTFLWDSCFKSFLYNSAQLTELGPSLGFEGPSSIWICVVVLRKVNGVRTSEQTVIKGSLQETEQYVTEQNTPVRIVLEKFKIVLGLLGLGKVRGLLN